MSHQSGGVSSAPVALLADDDLFLEHAAPPDHPERPQRLLAVRAGLERAEAEAGATFTRLRFGDASEEQLLRVHDAAYIESLGHLAGRSGYLDSDTYLSPGSVAAAQRAAGSSIALVEALHHGTTHGSARVGFAVPRPPGHHALAERAMGFCVLNNVAIAAAHARSLGRERVVVLDWDVHHGNGTEAMFYADPTVLFVSLHQYPNYPGTGSAQDLGRGEGRGHNVNLPLPPGATDAVYAAAFERIVLPIIETFAPDFALVSCGFDAHQRDPLAQMELSARGFASMTTSLLRTLPEGCPLGLVLEGGYDLQALSESSQAVGRVLLSAPVARAALDGSAGPSRDLPRDQSAALAHLHEVHVPFWYLG
jgi:acetoin utilization deacetylase AcuC-like enzyme